MHHVSLKSHCHHVHINKTLNCEHFPDLKNTVIRENLKENVENWKTLSFIQLEMFAWLY